jgi:hypothetical protein
MASVTGGFKPTKDQEDILKSTPCVPIDSLYAMLPFVQVEGGSLTYEKLEESEKSS